MTLTVQVTQEDIDNGVPRSLGKCMLMLAIERAIGEPLNGCGYVSAWAAGDRSFTFEVERETIRGFDHGVKPQPFEFDLTEVVR